MVDENKKYYEMFGYGSGFSLPEQVLYGKILERLDRIEKLLRDHIRYDCHGDDC